MKIWMMILHLVVAHAQGFVYLHALEFVKEAAIMLALQIVEDHVLLVVEILVQKVVWVVQLLVEPIVLVNVGLLVLQIVEMHVQDV